MSEKMNSDDKIQQLYNKTKTLKSPADLDSLILGKIRELEQPPIPADSKKQWIYLPIAASILLAVFLQFKTVDRSEINPVKTVEIAQLPIKSNAVPKAKNANKNQLPEMFFIPKNDFNRKVVPACNGQLVEPDGVVDKLLIPKEQESEGKESNIPIKPLYSNKSAKKIPACDSVSKQIFK